jgi:hypothetical protein
MQVFISWSGDTSKHVALALRDWLPQVIQAVEPWMSDEDLQKGSRWLEVIGKQLEKNHVGIICLTHANLDSEWIHFEAGALAKGLEQSRILTYLFELTHSDVRFPLAQFNHTLANKKDTLKLLKAINEALPEKRLSEATLTKTFERLWPELQDDLDTIRKQKPVSSDKAKRDPTELAQETLELVRSMAQRQGWLEAWLELLLKGINADILPPSIDDPDFQNWAQRRQSSRFNAVLPPVPIPSGGVIHKRRVGVRITPEKPPDQPKNAGTQ